MFQKQKKNHFVSNHQSAYSARHMQSILSTILFLKLTQNSGLKMAKTFLDKSAYTCITSIPYLYFCQGSFFRPTYFFSQKIARKILLLACLYLFVINISFLSIWNKKWLLVLLNNYYFRNLHLKINSDVNLCNLGVFMV